MSRSIISLAIFILIVEAIGIPGAWKTLPVIAAAVAIVIIMVFHERSGGTMEARHEPHRPVASSELVPEVRPAQQAVEEEGSESALVLKVHGGHDDIPVSKPKRRSVRSRKKAVVPTETVSENNDRSGA